MAGPISNSGEQRPRKGLPAGLARPRDACSAARVILVLDNRDSFTFNLVQAFSGMGQGVLVRRSSEIDPAGVLELGPERILIGPGPGRPEGAGSSLELVRHLAGRVPILGVCLGHQAIGMAFGASIVPAATLVHGSTVALRHDGRGIFEGVESPARFTRYNSLSVGAEHLPSCLEISARSEDGDVMGLRHRELPLEGVQFHPESILSAPGSRLLSNFLKMRARVHA
jgi:anthranilate synthase/aminodeoxychorismate synthase-like glutamine amidotransferase